MIKIYSPASIGNIGVGFDVLGVAISPIDKNIFLGDEVTITSNKTFQLSVKGKFANQLPNDPKENIVFQCWNSFCHEIKKTIPMSITLKKNMPISSGLGSSACSIVASIVGINEFCNKPLKERELIRLMGKLEEKISGSVHYDNVIPCYLGGLQIILEHKNILNQNVPYFKNWLWVVSWPGTQVSTSNSRNVLPKIYTKNICIQHSRSLAGFIHASHTNQSHLASKLIHDIIAEPYRIKLLPGFLEAKKAARELGAIGFGISGSGPTIFAICEDIKIAQKLLKWFNKNYLKTTQGFTHICHINSIGTKKVE